eukprot:7660073-Alexandrium_andersonii.AAC.1
MSKSVLVPGMVAEIELAPPTPCVRARSLVLAHWPLRLLAVTLRRALRCPLGPRPRVGRPALSGRLAAWA